MRWYRTKTASEEMSLWDSDIPIITNDVINNGRRYKSNKEQIVPGRTVKVRPAKTNAIMVGQIERIDFIEALIEDKGTVKPIRRPIFIIKLEDGTQLPKIDPASPSAEVWLFEDPEKLPLDQYKGMWVRSTDPAVVEMDEGIGMLMKRDGKVCTLRVMKDDLPWTVNVPCSSVKPSRTSPEWGIPFSNQKVPFVRGDVVATKSDPSSYLTFEGESEDNPGLVMVRSMDQAADAIAVKPEDLIYIGRYEKGKGIIRDPHFSSPALTPVPPKPSGGRPTPMKPARPAPAPAPKKAPDTE